VNVGRGNIQGIEKGLRHLVVVMLTGMYQYVLYFLSGILVVLFDGPDKGGYFHKIGTRAYHGNNLHTITI
jgi:hypothetical protein